jgi:glycosyltransferase involved in cell wall biosynthesis
MNEQGTREGVLRTVSGNKLFLTGPTSCPYYFIKLKYIINEMKPDYTICLATSQFEGIDHGGGIGTYYRELSLLLAKNGWNVTVLYLSQHGGDPIEKDINAFSNYFFNTWDIRIYDARVLCKSVQEENEIEQVNDTIAESDRFLAQSHILHEAIQVLQQRYDMQFDIIEFHEWEGIGAIPARMKKIFGDYKNTRLMVKLHSPDAWIKESFFRRSLCPKDLKIDYLNRYSFENADIQVSPTRYLLEWCKYHGWNVRDDASVCRNILSFPQLPVQGEIQKENIIAFFGRIEERKGVFEFIDSLWYIKKHLPKFPEKFSIAFVGKEGKISKEMVKKRLPEFELQFHTFNDREDALRFIRDKVSLVVIPSWQDNFPNTILECMSLSIPFITSRGGGIPEILGRNSELYDAISCDVTDPRQLGDLIVQYLDNGQENISRLLSLANARVKELVNPHEIIHWYEKVAEGEVSTNNYPTGLKNSTDPDPPVTVLMLVGDQVTEKYLETTLNSVLMQTFKNVNIIIQDSSTDPHALVRFEDLKNKYRENGITFLHTESSKGSDQINQTFSLIDSKYLVVMDGRNIAKPGMLDLFVKSMENQGSIAAMSCYYQGFLDSDERDIIDHMNNVHDRIPKISSVFSSVGPCIPLIFFENIMGDSNSIYRTDVLKKVGGWPYAKNGYSDWTMRVKLLASGYHLDIVPQVLLYSRETPETGREKLKLLYVDEVNINYIKQLIKEYPELYSQYYGNVHKLVRCPNPQGRKSGIEQSPLVMISKKLGEFAEQHRAWKKIFVFSGNFVKKILIKMK